MLQYRVRPQIHHQIPASTMWSKDFGVSLATGKMSDARRREATTEAYWPCAADDILTVDEGRPDHVDIWEDLEVISK